MCMAVAVFPPKGPHDNKSVIESLSQSFSCFSSHQSEKWGTPQHGQWCWSVLIHLICQINDKLMWNCNGWMMLVQGLLHWWYNKYLLQKQTNKKNEHDQKWMTSFMSEERYDYDFIGAQRRRTSVLLMKSWKPTDVSVLWWSLVIYVSGQFKYFEKLIDGWNVPDVFVSPWCVSSSRSLSDLNSSHFLVTTRPEATGTGTPLCWEISLMTFWGSCLSS